MSRFNSTPSREYSELRQAIEEYAESGTEPGESVGRVVADALEDHLREGFQRAYDLDETTDGANCIGRLISGSGKCTHGGYTPKGDDSGHPPHHPPHTDHCNLWLRDGDAALFGMHLYDTGHDVISDLVDFADTWGLEMEVLSGSWYYLGSTTHIVFYPPEWPKSL